ncbi:MAG TPA: transglutaminase family protein, partial [Polyangiaceae bacterium]|nr:transglutaminase family protein [Polyangiaceae bacterium]
MSIHVALHHRTSYRYDRPITLGPQTVRLRPAPHCRSRILSYALKVLPDPHFTNWQQDPQSNYVARLVFPERATEFSIVVDLVVEMAAVNPFDYFLEPHAETYPFDYGPELREELAPYLRTSPPSPRLEAFVEGILRGTRRAADSGDPDEKPRTNDFLVNLNQRLCEQIDYRVRLEPGLQTPDETLEKASGSCRDSGWLLVQILRRLGFAARFASGYLVQLTADTKPLEGPAGPATDFVDLHAWCEVYLPGAGWIGLDPTSGLLAGEGHLPLACTAEPGFAAPVSGVVEKCDATFEHEMTVTRVVESPRVTKPYTEAQWGEIVALGHAIDRDLQAGDVRLTMGGEPTFVSEDDPDGDEWNTGALGPAKKRLAADLFWRLQDRYAPHGAVQFGQGKWYPGEPLPRWSLNLHWRHDGEPMWSDRTLIANEAAPSGADEAQAARLIRGVARRLGVDGTTAFPAYEDVYYYLWRERKLPVNVDPFASRLDDPLERDRLRRIFSTGLDKVVGHALPITKSRDGSAWVSASWQFRAGRCYLVPGDSPMGLRLPLDARPWLAPEDRDVVYPPDPAQPVQPLATHEEIRRKAERATAVSSPSGSSPPRSSPPPKPSPEEGERAGEPGPWSPRSALCAES